jgi:hypothetical protein
VNLGEIEEIVEIPQPERVPDSVPESAPEPGREKEPVPA